MSINATHKRVIGFEGKKRNSYDKVLKRRVNKFKKDKLPKKLKTQMKTRTDINQKVF